MKRMLAIAVVWMLFAASPASAQYCYGPGFGGGFGYRSSFHFSFGGPRFHFSSYYRGFYAAPIVPLYYSYYSVPAYGPGYGPGFGNPFFLPPPPFVGPSFPVANTVPVNPDAGPVRNANAVVPALAVKGEFLVITPKGSSTKRVGEEGTITPVVDRVAAAPERQVRPAFQFDPFADRRVLGLTDVPQLDPAAEALRQVGRAKAEFAREEYGRAAEHIDRALRVRPDDTRALFLKGQAQFAAGQYAEAVATIQDGIKATPNWPASAFKPKDLYGKPERFEAHLADLRKALAANPTQPALQFLLAHQLWFTSDRVEATKLFRDLANRLNDTAAIEPFLRK